MKTVVVTGVSRGLGLAICHRLLADKFKVVGLSRSLSAEFQALIDNAPEQAFFRPFDVTDFARVGELAREIKRDHGRVFGLVNNVAKAWSDFRTAVMPFMAETNVRLPRCSVT